MNVDKLITCVQDNRCLWDMRDKSYHNREMCRRGWETVAAELNTSRPIPKRHLQGNVPRSTVPSSDDEDSFSPSVEDEPESQTETLVPPQDTRDETPPPQTLHANFAVPQKKVAKVSNANVVRQLMKLEEEKLQMFRERNPASRNEDPDYHFLMSLLPYLRKVPEERKMLVRTKLQRVFCEEEERFRGLHTPQPIHHTAPTFSSTSSTNGSWASDSPVATPHSIPQHDDLQQQRLTLTIENASPIC
nr:unnamed protein product [Callosobruchus analis]